MTTEPEICQRLRDAREEAVTERDRFQRFIDAIDEALIAVGCDELEPPDNNPV